MNPDSNKFEMLEANLFGKILRPNGEPVPQHWTQFRDGEQVEVKGYIFEVKCIGEVFDYNFFTSISYLLFLVML